MKTSVSAAIRGLIRYGEERGLIEESDRIYCFNRLLEMLKLDGPDGEDETAEADLPELLQVLTDSAAERGLIADGIVSRDLYDSLLMDALTPYPHEVRRRFAEKYAESPEAATDWFYAFSRDTNYIRRDRIAKDLKWKTATEYGELDITINLSKPEKDPKAIAAARNLPASAATSTSGSWPHCSVSSSAFTAHTRSLSSISPFSRAYATSFSTAFTVVSPHQINSNTQEKLISSGTWYSAASCGPQLLDPTPLMYASMHSTWAEAGFN